MKQTLKLFRCIYVRDGKPRGMTFAAANAAMAADFAYTILQPLIHSMQGGWVLTVKPIESRRPR